MSIGGGASRGRNNAAPLRDGGGSMDVSCASGSIMAAGSATLSADERRNTAAVAACEA